VAASNEHKSATDLRESFWLWRKSSAFVCRRIQMCLLMRGILLLKSTECLLARSERLDVHFVTSQIEKQVHFYSRG
jgi:hypothetical protein